MRAFVIVELDPVTDCAACLCQAFEAMTMDTLLFQGTDQTLHHAVLLRAMRCDELLFQAVATDEFGVGAMQEALANCVVAQNESLEPTTSGKEEDRV